MISPSRRIRATGFKLLLAGSLLAGAGAAHGQATFGQIDRTPDGRIDFSAVEDANPIVPGSTVEISGSDFEPGQTVALYYGNTPLVAQPLTADQEGNVKATFTVPQTATVGNHPIVVVSQNPYFAATEDLKVSPDVPLSGQDRFDITQAHPTRGLYQSVYSAKNNAVFVTSAIGRPPVRQSELVRLDAGSLEALARVTPAAAPQRPGRDGQMQDGGVYAVYGVAVDDVRDTVWVTNTRQNTVAIYSQSDLSLIKQFDPGTVNHARDVRVDAELGKAYASATQTPEVIVFDTATNTVAKAIKIQSAQRGEDFNVASLSLDSQAHRLYAVSLSTAEVAVIDTRTDEVLKVFAVPGARSAIGISHDPQSGRIFVAAQGSDNLVVLDGESGNVIADTPVGAGALNVAFDPVSRLAYVTNRGSNTVTVTDADGKIVANLGPAPRANHVSLGADGTVFVVDKSAGARDAEADTLMRIRPRG